MKKIPIQIGFVTCVGYFEKNYPRSCGNCFSLRDVDGTEHNVVNFYYENLKEWMMQTHQTDICVKCIPKSENIWEICDDRIPKKWYAEKYCSVCTPLRMLPMEQRKEEMRGKTYRKYQINNVQYIMIKHIEE